MIDSQFFFKGRPGIEVEGTEGELLDLRCPSKSFDSVIRIIGRVEIIHLCLEPHCLTDKIIIFLRKGEMLFKNR
jgi:hypothetical protein